MGGIALMWRGGCIIRSVFLGNIKAAFDKNPDLANLLLDDFFSSALNKYQASWRKAIIHGIEIGVPTPAISTALGCGSTGRAASTSTPTGPAAEAESPQPLTTRKTEEPVSRGRNWLFKLMDTSARILKPRA